MLRNVLTGALMIIATTGIHAEGMRWAMRFFRLRGAHGDLESQRKRIYVIGGVVLIMFLVSVVEVTVWAGVYLLIGAIEGLEAALYFSTVTFTTLGYGDMVLSDQWRLLSAFEAANGIIMFGWSTAIVIAAVQRVYFSEGSQPSR
ncbi:MAG: potassium channel family protein [Desulfobacteraceae bacterium]|jgi:hypothetical protein